MDTILYANDMPLGKITKLNMHRETIEDVPHGLPDPGEWGGRHFRPGTASWEITVTKPTASAYTLVPESIYVFTLGGFSPAMAQRQEGKVRALAMSSDAVTLFITEHPELL